MTVGYMEYQVKRLWNNTNDVKGQAGEAVPRCECPGSLPREDDTEEGRSLPCRHGRGLFKPQLRQGLESMLPEMARRSGYLRKSHTINNMKSERKP